MTEGELSDSGPLYKPRKWRKVLVDSILQCSEESLFNDMVEGRLAAEIDEKYMALLEDAEPSESSTVVTITANQFQDKYLDLFGKKLSDSFAKRNIVPQREW